MTSLSVTNDITEMVHITARSGQEARTQARLISGVKAFYRYLKS